MTETTKMAEIAKESNGKKDKKQNLWKMFRRKKGNNTTSTTKKSKSQTDNSKDILGNLFSKNHSFPRLSGIEISPHLKDLKKLYHISVVG